MLDSVEHWIEVPMRIRWFETLDPEEFNVWADKMGIEWNFKTMDVFTPCFLFKTQEDVIAFKLKFGL